MEAYLIFFVAGVGSEVGFIFLDKAKVPGTRYNVPEFSKVKMRYNYVPLSWRKILQNVRIEEVGEIMNTGLLRTVLRPAVSPSLTPPAPRKEHCGFNAEALRGIFVFASGAYLCLGPRL